MSTQDKTSAEEKKSGVMLKKIKIKKQSIFISPSLPPPPHTFLSLTSCSALSLCALALHFRAWQQSFSGDFLCSCVRRMSVLCSQGVYVCVCAQIFVSVYVSVSASTRNVPWMCSLAKHQCVWLPRTRHCGYCHCLSQLCEFISN